MSDWVAHGFVEAHLRHDALSELIGRYAPLVYAAAKQQLPDASLAEDVTQAVFMVLARRYRSLGRNVVMAAWLLRTTHLVCLQARRNAARRMKHERRAALMRPRATPAPEMTAGDLMPRIDAALATLSVKDRSAITLRYIEQRTAAQVGERLGVSPEAAQKRIGRALVRLRQALGVPPERLSGATLGAFFADQMMLPVPGHLAARAIESSAAFAAGQSAGAAALISQGVLKTMFWMSMKFPLAACAVALACAAGVLVAQPGTGTAPAPGAPATAPGTTPAPATAKAQDLAIGETDIGKTLRLGDATTASISLTGNPTTGYSWTVSKVEGDAIQQVGQIEYLPDRTRAGIVGSGGVFVARFRAVKQGQSKITMAYARPWETGIAPIRSFDVTVVVEKAPQ